MLNKLYLLTLVLFLSGCIEKDYFFNENSDIECYISFYIKGQQREIYSLEFIDGKKTEFIIGYDAYVKEAREGFEFHKKLAKENNGIPIIVSNPPISENYSFSIVKEQKKSFDRIIDKTVLYNNGANFNIYDYFTKESWERVFIKDQELRKLEDLEHVED